MLEEVVLFSLLLKESLDELTLELDELVAGVQEAMISTNNVGTILLNFICGNNILVK
jgi:division protein CdvB (Snf7/Vps24/ESCRT-III family)